MRNPPTEPGSRLSMSPPRCHAGPRRRVLLIVNDMAAATPVAAAQSRARDENPCALSTRSWRLEPRPCRCGTSSADSVPGARLAAGRVVPSSSCREVAASNVDMFRHAEEVIGNIYHSFKASCTSIDRPAPGVIGFIAARSRGEPAPNTARGRGGSARALAFANRIGQCRAGCGTGTSRLDGTG